MIISLVLFKQVNKLVNDLLAFWVVNLFFSLAPSKAGAVAKENCCVKTVEIPRTSTYLPTTYRRAPSMAGAAWQGQANLGQLVAQAQPDLYLALTSLFEGIPSI